MINIDLDFITTHFGVTNLKYYFEGIRKASRQELKDFREEVKAHKRKNKNVQAFSNVQNYSTHDAIQGAIDYELLKRSKFRYSIYKLFFPFRKKVLHIRKGIELYEHPHCGSIRKYKNGIKSFLHYNQKELFSLAGKFWLRNWKWIIGTSIVLAGLILKLMGKI